MSQEPWTVLQDQCQMNIPTAWQRMQATVFWDVEAWPSVWVQDCAKSKDEHTNSSSQDATLFFPGFCKTGH
eukprot:6467929-Amphidinium_carterae.1